MERNNRKMKKEKTKNKNQSQKSLTKCEKGITLIALVVTTIFSYDEKLKCSNNKGFLLATI